MDFVLERTDNDHIIDHSIYYFDAYFDQQDSLEEFYLQWIELNAMPNIEEFIEL